MVDADFHDRTFTRLPAAGVIPAVGENIEYDFRDGVVN
jgi:hypothetical protein